MSDDQTWRAPSSPDGRDETRDGTDDAAGATPEPPRYGQYAPGHDASGASAPTGAVAPTGAPAPTDAPAAGYPPAGAPQPGYPQAGAPQNSYQQPGYPQPGYPQSGYAQSGYPQPGYQQPGYQQPGYQQAGSQQPGYQQPIPTPPFPGAQQPGWQQQPAPGQHGQWQYAGAPGQQPGWAPPPKPGLVPLRPLAFGTLLGAPFQALRRNPRVTVGAALLLQGLPSILVTVMFAAVVYFLMTRVGSADAADQGAIAAGAIGASVVLGVLSIVISTVFSALLQGIVVAEVSRETLGEKLTFGSLWRIVKGRLGALIGWAFLFALAWLVAVALVVAIVVALAAIGGPAGAVGAVLVGIFGGLGLIVIAVWVNTKLAVVPSAIVIERLTIGAAVSRSWRLTNGFFWRTFGVIVLIAMIIGVVTQVISTPFSLLGGIMGGFFAPTSLSSSDESAFTQVLTTQLGVNILASIVGAVIGAVGSVVQTAAVALIYIDLRMRKEGLDLSLVRFVEARQTGQETPDPYTQPAATVPPMPGAPWPGV